MELRGLWLLPLLLLLLLPDTGDGKSRPQRSLIELVEAVQCSTKVSVLEYTVYGCSCGLGRSGWPQDKTDWCCHCHDCCYGKAEVPGCSPKLDPYNFVCKYKQVECDSLKDRCQKMICKCDSEAAKCWAKTRFNPSLEYFQQNSYGTIQPLCKADKNEKRVLLENH